MSSNLQAEGTIDSAKDCTEIEIDYSDDPALSREERVKRMNEAFYRSLDKYDSCMSSTTNRNAAGTGGGSQAGNPGAEGGQGNANTSQASSGISGTETPTEVATTGSELPQKSEQNADPDSVIQDEDVTEISQTTLDNGAIPEDIPEADNDSVFEAQIRAAAIKETDPEKKRRIWNEYRKLKGLPTEEIQE